MSAFAGLDDSVLVTLKISLSNFVLLAVPFVVKSSTPVASEFAENNTLLLMERENP
jgi:hypothetical protein